MATALFGSLFQFNPDEHVWTEYVEIFEHYFTANKIKEDELKVSILCSNVGPKTYHVIKNLCLPKKPSELKFQDIVDLVKNHYKPKMTEASASLKFNTRNRMEGESMRMFVAELRRLAAPCNYGSHLDRALKDRFIAGVNDKDIQEKILNVPDEELTFEKAFKIAESHETACRNVKEMQRNSGPTKSDMEQETVNKLRGINPKATDNSQGTVKAVLSCSRCGGKHDSESCWAKNKNCFKCGKKGHTKVKCRKDQEKVKLVSVES